MQKKTVHPNHHILHQSHQIIDLTVFTNSKCWDEPLNRKCVLISFFNFSFFFFYPRVSKFVFTVLDENAILHMPISVELLFCSVLCHSSATFWRILWLSSSLNSASGKKKCTKTFSQSNLSVTSDEAPEFSFVCVVFEHIHQPSFCVIIFL